MRDICPFCGLYPWEEVDIGVGSERVAVTCCMYGAMKFQDGVPEPIIAKLKEAQEAFEEWREQDYQRQKEAGLIIETELPF